MRCEDCNVEITCKTDVCPLCHKSLNTGEEKAQEIKKLERAYPKRHMKRPHNTTPFNMIYFIVSINIITISVVLNIIFTPKTYWSMIVVGLIFYIYFLVRKTVLSYSHFNSKVMGQAIAVFIVFILIQRVLDKNLWIYEYVLPAIVFVSTIMIAAYIIINIEVARRYLFSLFVLAVLGLVPLAIVFFINDKIIWPSIVVAVTSASIILTTIIAARKILWAELKRIFHL